MSAQNTLTKKLIAASIPYFAMWVGVFVLGNGLITVLLYHLGIVVFITAEKRWDVAKSFRSGWDARLGIAAVVVSSLIGVVIYLSWPIAKIDGVELINVFERFGVLGSAGAVFAVYAVIVNPVLEEILWRGYLFDERKGLCWVDAAFAGFHVMLLTIVLKSFPCVGGFFVMCFAGWMFRTLRRRLGGLGVAWLMHLVADVSILVGIYFLLQSR